jgi:hypothetical protein
MEQIIIYIIISVILLFLRGAGKQQKKQAPQNSPDKPKPSSSTKPVSGFEELLRQLQEINTESKPQKQEQSDAEKQEQRLQNSKRFKVEDDYFSYESDIPNQGMADEERYKDQHEGAYVLKTVGNSRFRKKLQSRSAVTEAIILNEIINRKHF